MGSYGEPEVIKGNVWSSYVSEDAKFSNSYMDLFDILLVLDEVAIVVVTLLNIKEFYLGLDIIYLTDILQMMDIPS